MKKFLSFIILLSLPFLAPNAGGAQETKPKSLEGMEFLSGFGWGELREKEDYKLIPFIVDFNFNLKPLIQKVNINLEQLFQFQLEPFISFVSCPDANLETGTSFFLKTGLLPRAWKFQPYVKVGVGMVYLTQHTREQGSQFNFIEQGGAGIHYFFRKNIAFSVEYRMRHLSNANIEPPNKGIETAFLLAGISYQF